MIGPRLTGIGRKKCPEGCQAQRRRVMCGMGKGCRYKKRRFLAAVGLALLVAFSAPSLFARDVFVVISGGVSPFDNNYSQYLQAKAVAGYFRQHYPANSVWTFFGAGNPEGEKPFLCDVLREVRKDNMMMPVWEPGILPQNLPARSELILRKLREEILPAVAGGGTLFLFVGDHGSRTPGRNGESIINLWGMERDDDWDHGWSIDEKEALSVTQLRRALAAGIGKGKIVFCMTQCHSGGFHYLGIPREMTPNPAWFTVVPAWAAAKKQPDFPRVAGFTATDEESIAAGCDPDPVPENWSGYERFLPENLFGMNLFTQTTERKSLPSFATAHVVATLADYTIDKPRSTSEQYLERWADLLETRMAKETNLTSKARRALGNYRKTLDGAAPKGTDASFRELQRQFRAYTEKLSELSPGSRNMLLSASRNELEGLYKPEIKEGTNTMRNRGTNQSPQGPGRNRRGGNGNGRGAENRKLWTDTIRPAWQAAVEDGPVANLPAEAQDFEMHLLELEDQGENYFGGNSRPLRLEAYWEAGYGEPEKIVPAKAAAITTWSLQRRGQIIAWAKKSTDPDVRAAGEKLAPPGQRGGGRGGPPARTQNSPHQISREVAAERVMFYRRVLGAWEFLIAMNERPALARLHELMELERVPLP